MATGISCDRAYPLTSDASWQALVELHGETILKIAYRVLHNMHDAEDVAQQVLLEACAMKELPDIGMLKRMSAFRSIDQLRRRDRSHHFDDIADCFPSDVTSDTLESKEQAARLRDAIGRLPRRQARCFWLRYVEHLSNVEIAACQSISESAVSTALSKARRALRDALSKEYRPSHE